MKKLILVIAVLMLCLSVPAFAESLESATTQGLTSVTYTSTKVQKTVGSSTAWYQCVEFTLMNNTSNTSPLTDLKGKPFVVLVDKLSVFSTGVPTLWETPDSSWTFAQKNGFERFADTPSKKYWAPPSVEPQGSLSGFKLYFKLADESSTYVMPSTYGPLTHVLAVVPNTSTVSPLKYTETQVSINSLDGCTYKGNTWYDAPDTDDPHEGDKAVPELSSVFLGALGLVAPAGYALRRRRA